MRRINIFNKIPLIRPKANAFNLGFENKMTSDFFRLTPIACVEALPDDSFRIRNEIFARVSPMIAPMIHKVNIRTYWFFVPTRLIWDDFEKWINPKSGTTVDEDHPQGIIAPRIMIPNTIVDQAILAGPKTLGDYLGLNLGYDADDMASITAGDYTGITNLFPSATDNPCVSILPFRAYQQIYNDWFIDLNNMDEIEFDKGSGVYQLMAPGESLINLVSLRTRSWEHDYFTSALPDAQRGAEVMAFEGTNAEIDLSDLSVSAPNENLYVYSSAVKDATATDNYQYFNFIDTNTGDVYHSFGEYVIAHKSNFGAQGETDAAINTWVEGLGDTIENAISNVRSSIKSTDGSIVPADYYISAPNMGGGTTPVVVRPAAMVSTGTRAGKIADALSVSTGTDPVTVQIPGVTVEELRIRMQMQSFLERNEVGGSRYTEMLYAHWGVKDPDGRLQRAEFIGGSKQPLMVSSISQTSAPTDDDPLGQLAGQGLSTGMSRPLKFHCPEHGYIIGLACIMPRTAYQQGIHPMWNRFDRLDYYWPSFAHLGEQEVKNREVLFSGFDPEGTFGYQQRYAEYKTGFDGVHGDMKGNLAHWHLTRVFATPTDSDSIPKLSVEFTTPEAVYGQSEGMDRIFPVANTAWEVQNADHFILDIYNHIKAIRRMPVFATPRNGS